MSMKVLVTQNFRGGSGSNIRGLNKILANSTEEVHNLVEKGLYTAIEGIENSISLDEQAITQVCYWIGQIGAELTKRKLQVYSHRRQKAPPIHIVTGSLMESIKSRQQGEIYTKTGKTGKKTIGLNVSIYIDTDVTRQELPDTDVDGSMVLSAKKYGMSVGDYRVLNPIRNNLAQRVDMQSLLKKYLGDSKSYVKLINMKGVDSINNRQQQVLSTAITVLKAVYNRLKLHNEQKIQRSIAIRRAEAFAKNSNA